MQNAVPLAIILAITLLAGVFLDRRYIHDFGFRKNKLWLLNLFGGLILGLLFASFVFVIQYFQGWIEVSASTSTRMELVRTLTLWAAVAAVVATAEELVFRGYQLKNLCEGLSAIGPRIAFAIATIASSVVFGLIHGVNPNSGPFAVISILCAGIMFCVGRLCTGSLAAPIGLHFSWNYSLAFIFGLPISGQRMEGTLIQSRIVSDSIWTGGEFGPEASPLVIFCMIFGVLAFVFWPYKVNVSAELDKLTTFVPRHAR